MQDPDKRRLAGRPSKYTEELGREICERHASGELLTHICRDDHMPSWMTMWAWADDETKPEFGKAFRNARRLFTQVKADECFEIADNSNYDTITRKARDGSEFETCDREWVARSQLRVKTRMSMISKINNREFGEKTQTEVTAPQGLNVKIGDGDSEL